MRSRLATHGPPTTTPVQRHGPNMPHVQSPRIARKDKPCHKMPQKKNNPGPMPLDNAKNPYPNPDQQSNKNNHAEGHCELDLVTVRGDSTAKTAAQ